ncbi:MAG: restriction endonuclease subunit S [Desulfurellaceae bacterium]|nr:restriction endonuclease subunit S [Desulfurellaceae bacterium]
MNAEHLLTHFDRLADAPDAIPRLRRFILDLTVRGKLVEQDPEDELAGELLKKIAPEKQRLVAEGKFKSLDTTELDNEAEHVPFTIPANWVWCRLDDIAAIARGGSPRPIKAYLTDDKDGINWIKIGDSDRGSIYINETKEKIRPDGLKKSRMVFPNDLILSNSMSFGYPYILNIQGCIHDGWLVIRTPDGLLDKLFLYNLLLSSHSRNTFSNAAAGAVVQNLNADKVRQLPVPLPPLAEQHRIVAKVDELMAVCDRLETARKEREATRDRLVTASLARLNASDPGPAVFQNHAAFALNNLTPLTTRPDQIKALRQTILNLAVRGKLVEQDPEDEPAGELLRRVAAEKKRLVEAGEIRKLRMLSLTDEAPFDIPPSWEWRALGEIVHLENGDRSKNYPSGGDIKTMGIPFFNTKNVSDYAVKFDQLDFITEEKFKSLRSGKMKDLDILITLRGSVGKLGLFQATEQFTTGFINAQLLIVRNIECSLVRFCLTFMKSQVFLNQIFARSSGSTTPQLSASQLAEVLIPLPPLAEQRRIVAQVDELMVVCDRLEAGLAAGEKTRGRLVEAVLHETLATGRPEV